MDDIKKSKISAVIMKLKEEQLKLEKKPVVAFDCDGTLINFNGQPKPSMIKLVQIFSNLGCDIVIWSGSGPKYVEILVEELGLRDLPNLRIEIKNSFRPDIAFDDGITDIGLVNVHLPMEFESNEEDSDLPALDMFENLEEEE